MRRRCVYEIVGDDIPRFGITFGLPPKYHLIRIFVLGQHLPYTIVVNLIVKIRVNPTMLIGILQAIVVGLLDELELSIESAGDWRVLEELHWIG